MNTETAHPSSKDKEEDADKVKEPTEKEVSSCEEAPEQTESEKKAEEDEGAMDCPANSVPPSPQHHSPSPQSSPPEDFSVKPEEDVNSDQVTGETTENNHRESDLSDDSGKEKPTISDHKGSEAANSVPPSPQRHSPSPQSSPPEDISVKPEEDVNSDQVTGETTENNHRESDLSDDSGKEKPTISDHKGSEATAHEQDANLTQGGTDTKEGNQQEMGKPVSQDDSESVDEQEDIDKAQNQSVATSQNPECATLTTADNSNTCTSDVSPNIIENTHADPEQEGNTIGVSDQSKGQPDSTTADEGQSLEKKNEDQCGPKEEKPGNTSLNEDKEEIK
ncbi:uncharacterized protein LOC128368139 [Scomber japonicus]|uniref:uncharacterized protein LOC128368139 n=1 Tax=Scomber japonicus TaxID=13676 RepID=UPI002305561B|nr:uncharacterized protein LOC128368139 [Scomber japonicus]